MGYCGNHRNATASLSDQTSHVAGRTYAVPGRYRRADHRGVDTIAARVTVAPQMIEWARRRARKSVDDLVRRFPKLRDWESGDAFPTMRQLQDFASATYVPVGYLFLPEPPIEELPLPDFRTIANEEVRTPSPDLLDTIYLCEQRQAWFQDFAIGHDLDDVLIVRSLDLRMTAEEAASNLRDLLRFGLAQRVEYSNWSEALSGLAEHAEAAGVMVMVSGVVGSNTHRRLDPREFRGFSLVDVKAPIVFVNGADTKAAQIFTLAHELAHVGLGGSALSRPDLGATDESDETESWCNAVAAELLVPGQSLTDEYISANDLTSELDRLARFYKVSTLVVLRRLYDKNVMGSELYRSEYEREYDRVMEQLSRGSSGGNFYNTQPVRTSKRFARALISDTIEGGTLYRDAYRLLGFKAHSTFEELSQRLGVA